MREIRHGKDDLWQTTSVVDGEAIDHERIIGTVVLDNESILIRVAQRVDYDLLADPVQVRVHPPRITIGGCFELNDGQADELLSGVAEAASFSRQVRGRSPASARIV
jgi:hypothetical protein